MTSENLLPTPTGTDYKSRGKNSKQIGIDNFLKLIPTPKSCDWKNMNYAKDQQLAKTISTSLPVDSPANLAPHRRDRVWIIAKHTKGKFRDSCGYRSREEEEDSRLGKSNQYEDRKDTSNTKSWESGESSKSQGWENFSGRNWETNWLEIATRLCGVDDGVSARVDGLELSKSRHRIERLKGLGNAIVPQVAIEIFKAIMSSRKEII